MQPAKASTTEFHIGKTYNDKRAAPAALLYVNKYGMKMTDAGNKVVYRCGSVNLMRTMFLKKMTGLVFMGAVSGKAELYNSSGLIKGKCSARLYCFVSFLCSEHNCIIAGCMKNQKNIAYMAEIDII